MWTSSGGGDEGVWSDLQPFTEASQEPLSQRSLKHSWTPCTDDTEMPAERARKGGARMLALFCPAPALDIARGRDPLASASASLPRLGNRPASLRQPWLRCWWLGAGVELPAVRRRLDAEAWGSLCREDDPGSRLCDSR